MNERRALQVFFQDPPGAPASVVRAREFAADLALRLAAEALEALSDRGIAAAPLKGAVLLRRWPELRGHRDLADVDLLVEPERFPSAVDALRGLGFQPTSYTFRGATLARKDWPLSIDLHHRLFGPHLFDMPTLDVMRRAQRDDEFFAGLSMRVCDEDLFAHVVGHAVKSRMRLDDPHAVDDIRWLLGVLPIRPEAYAQHLRRLGMRRAAGCVLAAPAYSRQPLASEIVDRLALTADDRAAIRMARVRPTAYWTPHLLNSRPTEGIRSFRAQVREDLGWRMRRWSSLLGRSVK